MKNEDKLWHKLQYFLTVTENFENKKIYFFWYNVIYKKSQVVSH